ncbi:DEAD/DEAH box helicase [Alicyclobacillus macrosporangiidus]|uniref:DEAD/DEAH box helicase domain-containing protein n=1 Tax=Alicyclobacillus macrosporangiidus TaxID=392015 RepID=A0A1I7G5Q4_9BACL|nr:DEAD/DEAH box helicase [Alicyclobacillus macrosporangiidus]SFU43774.1 DEAD/DEAH box helicase domain-containing protein [Alicyclobacillus macrosporangiidus]
MEGFWKAQEWQVVHRHVIPGRDGTWVPFEDLPLSREVLRYLRSSYPSGVYRHQRAGIESFLKGHHTCLTTGTSSGKTLAFVIAALQVLSEDPDAKVIALYPMKSLGTEQEQRWRKALAESGLPCTVGRIDGDVDTHEREKILANSNVIAMTPDVMHAWLLAHVGDAAIAKFIRKLRLVIVDEVHTYTGVFGTNSAFLFRRLYHVNRRLGGQYRYFCASATMRDPAGHLAALFGTSFVIIGPDFDSSPRFDLEVQMVSPPPQMDLLTAVAELLRAMSNEHQRFIAFADSRKQTEQIAAILARQGSAERDEETSSIRKILRTLDILPYRAGYEDQDRAAIQRRLSHGELKGVVSTSALELGLDIPGVDAGVLIGVPYSHTSFLQRIGRVGRHQPGTVYVVKAGSVLDEVVFREPELLMSRPLSESALYLENRQLQYIHAMCLARPGGEHDQINVIDDYESSGEQVELCSEVTWPTGFREMCHDERTGEISVEFQNLKLSAGDRPNATFPLRDVEMQFDVEIPNGPDMRRLGSLSYSQVMREAYPGAVYYYATRPHRITKVDPVSRTITARPERHYTTSPNRLPTRIYPNLTTGNVFSHEAYGPLVVTECRLQLQDSVAGYRERRGPTEISVHYPLPLHTGIHFRSSVFTRYYFSSGIVITHPVLNDLNGHQMDQLTELLYEGFLITIPFERQDIGFGHDKHRREHPYIPVGSRFISIFDQTYGSLRLSGRLAEPSILRAVLDQSHNILHGGDWRFEPALGRVVQALLSAAQQGSAPIPLDEAAATVESSTDIVAVIRPGSVGLAVRRNNEHVTIENVFYHPVKGLSYRVRYSDGTPGAPPNADIIWSIEEVVPLEGESEIARYNPSTGELV